MLDDNKLVTKKTLKKQTKESFKEALQEAEGKNGDVEEIDISDQNIDALKYALHTIINNKGSIAGTTNLKKAQIHALTKMKALNYFYKSKAIDEYYYNVLEMQRSETENPTSILESIGNLFKFPTPQNDGIGSKLRRILPR